MSFSVAIIGRPNVGKSTLFNRLVGKRLALVHDTPGLTRDRREAEASIQGLSFTVIDTAGLEDGGGESLKARMRTQTEQAVSDADVALLIIDARAGLTPMDEHFANWLRASPTPIILIANKCEGAKGDSGLLESFALGLGEPIAISAEHNMGMLDLRDALEPFAEAASSDAKTKADEDDEDHSGPLNLAIVGRPNVGKSTLVNRLLGEDRMLTGPEAGITRDAIATTWDTGETTIRLVDTAGMRRRSKVKEKLEGLSVGDTLRTIRYANVVVLLMDADAILDKQDLTIARMVIEEGRALIIAINKWDICSDRKNALQRLKDRLQTSLPQVRGIPIVTLSALRGGRGVDKLLPAITNIYELWNKRISTGPINRWLAQVEARHPPPLVSGRRIRLRYMTQAKIRPPTFMVSTSRPDKLPESYIRYLINGLRETFGLEGIPLRIHLRKSKNPYAPRS